MRKTNLVDICECVTADRLGTMAIRRMKDHDNRTILSPLNKLLFQMLFGFVVLHILSVRKQKRKKLFFRMP